MFPPHFRIDERGKKSYRDEQQDISKDIQDRDQQDFLPKEISGNGRERYEVGRTILCAAEIEIH
jgi:hypothetical protein